MYEDLEMLQYKMDDFLYDKKKNEREEWKDFVLDIRKFLDYKEKIQKRRKSARFRTKIQRGIKVQS